MNKFKKKKLALYLIIVNVCALIYSSLFFSQIGDVYAWLNKRNDVVASNWEDWSAYNRDLDYATHDWIADFAVEYITNPLNPYLRSKWFDANGHEFWTPRRVRIFLYATAGLDNSRVQFRSRHGQIVHGPGDSRAHHIYFDEGWDSPFFIPTKEVIDDTAGVRAQKFAQNAINAFNDGDCDLAAFFLGEMVHYISDMSMYEHVIEGILDNSHAKVEAAVARRTSGRYLPNDPYVHENREYFFRTLDTYVLIDVLDVRGLAINLAFDTRWNPTDEYGTLKAKNMTKLAIKYNMRSEKQWGATREAWITDQTDKFWYIYRIEESLNLAIQHVISSLNWVITQVQSYQCKANSLEEVVEGSASLFYLSLTLLIVQQLVSLIGLYASISAVSITATLGKIK